MVVSIASCMSGVKRLLLSSANCHLSSEQSPTADSLATNAFKGLERRREGMSGIRNSSGVAEDDQKSLQKRIEI